MDQNNHQAENITLEKLSNRVNSIIAAQLELDVPKLSAEFMRIAELIKILDSVAENEEPSQPHIADGNHSIDIAKYVRKFEQRYRRSAHQQNIIDILS